MIGIIDYRAGNLASVARALEYLRIPCTVTDDGATLERCERIIFPGVGAAGAAMANLRSTGMDRRLKGWFAAGKPILGICLGTQIILSHSDENNTPCLGLLPGEVRRFPPSIRGDDERALKIPHMGWNAVHITRPHPVFDSIPKAAEFYFVHSYYPLPAESVHILGTTTYGITFCSIMAWRNLVAVQFHPEKSGRPGLQILDAFCRWGGEDAL